MSNEEQPKLVPVTKEAVAKRPLGGLGEPDFFTLLNNILNKTVELDPEHKVFSEELKASFNDVMNRVIWTTERMLAYECNLVGLVGRRNTEELEELLKERYEVLHYLFTGPNKDLSSKELIERIQGKWKRADTIVIEVDPKEPFDPIKLMSTFAGELRNYAIDLSKKDVPPEMITVIHRHGDIHRFINFDWIEWFLKNHKGKATPQQAIDHAVDQLKISLFGSVDAVPKGTTIAVDREKRDPEIIIEQITTVRI